MKPIFRVLNHFLMRAHAIIEVRPYGVACNLGCTYCYQEPIRAAMNKPAKADYDILFKKLEELNSDFTLFGGEAFLMPIKQLERFWKFGFEKFGKSSIQTNGTLIKDSHIKLMKKYNVSVGVSIDGPGELNGLRQVRADRSPEATLKSTETIMENLQKMRRAGLGIGVIITLHRENATAERLPRLLKFIDWLGNIGIRSGNIHTLEVNSTMPDQDIHVLSQEENAAAFVALANFFEERPKLEWNPFKDMRDVLKGDDDHALCFWKNCDPMDTQAVYGIEGDGALSNCGRTNKEGIDWYKANSRSYARYIAFYYTPDEMGGCQGCRFWMACGGSCPGESQNGDFRNKTIHCQTQKALLNYYEERLIERGEVPVTLSPDRADIERIMLALLRRKEPATINRVRRLLEHERNHVPRDVRIAPILTEEEVNEAAG